MQLKKKSNPGSLVKIQCDRVTPMSNTIFKRILRSFEAMKTGLLSFEIMEGFRPFIGIGGCHLKRPYWVGCYCQL